MYDADSTVDRSLHMPRFSRRSGLRLTGIGAFLAVAPCGMQSVAAQDASPVGTPGADCLSDPVQNGASAARWFTDVLNQGNLDVLDELLTPDARYLVPPLDRPDAQPEDTIFLIADTRRMVQSRVEQRAARGREEPRAARERGSRLASVCAPARRHSPGRRSPSSAEQNAVISSAEPAAAEVCRKLRREKPAMKISSEKGGGGKDHASMVGRCPPS